MKVLSVFLVLLFCVSLAPGQTAIRTNHFNMRFVADSVIDVVDGSPGSLFIKTTDGNERLVVENMLDGQSFSLIVTSATADTITWVTSTTWIGGGTPIHGFIGTNLYSFWQKGGVLYGISAWTTVPDSTTAAEATYPAGGLYKSATGYIKVK